MRYLIDENVPRIIKCYNWFFDSNEITIGPILCMQEAHYSPFPISINMINTSVWLICATFPRGKSVVKCNVVFSRSSAYGFVCNGSDTLILYSVGE